MTIREAINRLERLSNNGINDSDEVKILVDGELYDVNNIMINQDPYYDPDTANCGPDMWAEISVCE